MSLVEINQFSLDLLDWNILAQTVADACNSALGAENALRLDFASDAQAARKRFQRIEELQKAREREAIPPFQGMRELRPILAAAEGYEGLDSGQLCALRDFLFLLKQLKNWELEYGEIYP